MRRPPAPGASPRSMILLRVVLTWALAFMGILGFTWILASAVHAHEFLDTRTLVLLKEDGSFQVDMVCDLDALALGADPAIDSAELARALLSLPIEERRRRIERLHDYFLRRVRILVDGEPIPFTVALPEQGRWLGPEDVHEDPHEEAVGDDDGAETRPGRRLPLDGTLRPLGPATYLGTVARLEGLLPADASTVAIRASRSFPPLALRVIHEQGAPELRVDQGLPSPELPLVPEAEPLGTALGWSQAETLLLLGISSVIGSGLLLPLFVLGLLGVGPGERTVDALLFAAVTALTAGLAAAGQLWLPPSWAAMGGGASLLLLTLPHLSGGARMGPTWTRPTWTSPAWRPILVACGLLHGQLLALRFPTALAGAPADGTTGGAASFALGTLLALAGLAGLPGLVLRPRRSRKPSPSRVPGWVPGLVLGLVSGLAGLAVIHGAFQARGQLDAPFVEPSAESPNAAPTDIDEGPAEGSANATEVLKNPVFTLFLRPLGTVAEADP